MTKLFSSIISADGFGAQYQRIITTYIFCKSNNLPFVYSPFKTIEHNYNNCPSFNEKKEELINLKKNITNVTKDNERFVTYLKFGEVVNPIFEKNIDVACHGEHMAFIKKCFWENKERDVFKNGKMNVAIHIRRNNEHDNGRAGDRVTVTDAYFLNVMNKIRTKYHNKNLLFHIFSQGTPENFNNFKNYYVIFYIYDFFYYLF